MRKRAKARLALVVGLLHVLALVSGCAAKLPPVADAVPTGSEVLALQSVPKGYAVLSRNGALVRITVVTESGIYRGGDIPVDPTVPLPAPLIAGAFGTAIVAGVVHDARATAVELVATKGKVLRVPVVRGGYLFVYPPGDGHSRIRISTLDESGMLLSQWSNL
ncbi:MAG TPA: hypothetical protein VGK74_22700 [Symbiobacteriaceae bacterium]|jgi:hypothetical protein